MARSRMQMRDKKSGFLSWLSLLAVVFVHQITYFRHVMLHKIQNDESCNAERQKKEQYDFGSGIAW